jgi:hypothetical protein
MHVDVNNIKVLIVAMETQEWMSFALLSNHGIFPTAVNNENVLYDFTQCSRNFCQFFCEMWSVLTNCRKSPQNQILPKSVQWDSRRQMGAHKQTDRQSDRRRTDMAK